MRLLIFWLALVGLAHAQLVELKQLEPSLRLDIRYATSNNFMKRKLYDQARAFLVRPAAEALKRANAEFRKLGYGIVVFDGYRPWKITKLMWDETPPDKHQFVADPSKGSRHNRGCAVDLSLYDLKTGKYLEMPSGYDDFTRAAYSNSTAGTPKARQNRALLRRVMEKHGFRVLPEEWWHFDFQGWEKYPILDEPFPAGNP